MANGKNNSQFPLDAALFGAPQTVESVLAQATSGAGGPGDTAPNRLSNAMSQLNEQLVQLQSVGQAQTQATADNTEAVAQNTTQRGSSGSSTASSIGQSLSNAFGIGSALSPLISGIVSLFGGGGSSEAAPLTQYIPPSKVSIDAGVSDAAPGQVFGVDSAQGGQPRPVDSASTQSPQITIQVQAMDSQSFLDHSNDIAMAVRQAMLESSVLNDVIREV